MKDQNKKPIPPTTAPLTPDSQRTELVFILDRSGSMGGLEADTIGGFNSMLARQKQEAGEARVTTVLFDDDYELLHDRIELAAVAPITDRDYYVRGCTALLDAMGKTIQKIDRAQKSTAPAYRADKVIFMITTDGMENASRKFSYAAVKKLVEAHKEQGWEFLFFGANMDAIGAAGRLGIDEDRAVRYHSDHQGTQLNYEVLNDVLHMFRAAPASAPRMDGAWKKRIEKDFSARNEED